MDGGCSETAEEADTRDESEDLGAKLGTRDDARSVHEVDARGLGDTSLESTESISEGVEPDTTSR